MRLIMILALAATAAGGSRAARAAAADPETILKKADDVRNPSDSYKLTVTVDSPDEDQVQLEVSIKGKTKTLVKTLAPVRDRGKNTLMLGDEMWAYVPNLKRTVRVSLNQKLTGQAANGDICRQRWSGDYTPELEKETADQWVLLLTAERKGLTYDKIRLWIDKAQYHPAKAEYLTKNGKLLKRARFDEYKKLDGGVRPSETVITSASRDTDKSVIKIVDVKTMDFPDSLFDQNNLK